MTTEDITKQLPEGSRCLWQIVPSELPADLNPMALEMWHTPKGLVLFQFFTEDRRFDWYNRMTGHVRFEEAKP